MRRLHMTAKIVQQTFTGDLASPKLGDRLINNVELFDEDGSKVGTGGAVCTIVSEPPLDTLVECLLSALLDQGQIIFGGVAPFPAAGAVAHFGILGGSGTGHFRKARGVAKLVVLSTSDIDSIFDLE